MKVIERILRTHTNKIIRSKEYTTQTENKTGITEVVVTSDLSV